MESEWLFCTCCGDSLRDTPEENADHGMHSFDEGFGMCRGCEKWSSDTFFGSRIEMLQAKLSPENVAKLNAMSEERKRAVVARLIEKGVMI